MPIKRRRSDTPCPFKPGDRIQPVAMFEHHDYRQGETYTVAEIDAGDSTLRARNSSGVIGSWIRWKDCRAVNGIGWEWLKGQLPAETLELLSAFEGLDRLRLRQDVSAALVTGIPSLRERILGCAEKLEILPDEIP